MIVRENLREIVMLSYLTDEMLDELIPITDIFAFDEKDIVFQEGDKAERLYMLRRGKVLLEQRLSKTITVLTGSIKPGFTFGWSAMLDERAYTAEAVCEEHCEVLSFRADKLRPLLEKNHSMGFIISQRLLRVLKKRYDRRTEQLIRAIRNHPDMKDLF